MQYKWKSRKNDKQTGQQIRMARFKKAINKGMDDLIKSIQRSDIKSQVNTQGEEILGPNGIEFIIREDNEALAEIEK